VPATSITGRRRWREISADAQYGERGFRRAFDLLRRVAFAGTIFPGVDGLNALAFSNPPLGDFAQLSSNPAISGRFDFALPSPGLAWSVSAYFAPNINRARAHDGQPRSDQLGCTTNSATVTADGWELRGEGVS
jgi:hypothetical protein